MRHTTRPNRSFSNAIERGDRILREATAGAQARPVASRRFASLHRLPVVQDGSGFVRSRLLVTFFTNIPICMFTFSRIQHISFFIFSWCALTTRPWLLAIQDLSFIIMLFCSNIPTWLRFLLLLCSRKHSYHIFTKAKKLRSILLRWLFKKQTLCGIKKRMYGTFTSFMLWQKLLCCLIEQACLS